MDWPIQEGRGQLLLVDPLTASSDATAVAGSATANVKGAWVEVSASWPGYGGVAFTGQLSFYDHLFDIAVGALGSEVVIAENLYLGHGSTMRLMPLYTLPISINAGERVSVRVQAGFASLVPNVFVYSAPVQKVLGRCTTYGADTADSGGVSVDPGSTANTKGAWHEIAASTTNDIKALILTLGNAGDSSRTTCKFLVDVGIGAAGSEQVIISNYGAAARSEHDCVLPQVSQLIDVSIPAGSRIAVRAQCDITTAGDRLFDAIIYGFD